MQDVLTKIQQSRQQTQSLFDQISEALKSVRQEVARLKREAKAVERLPVPLDVVHARIDMWVELETETARSIFPKTQAFAAPDYRHPLCGADMALMALLAGQMRQMMKDQATEDYQRLSPLSDEEREMKFAAMDRQLLDLELAEESIIRQAEAAELPICRRSDADPRAVLAHDKVLP